MKRLTARLLLTPAMATLFVWMIVPLVMTIYFSLLRYNLLEPGAHAFAGIDNYVYFFTDEAFLPAVKNTLVLLFSVMGITVVVGIGLALLINEPFPGRAFVRILLVSPFFVMPAVNALMWKNMMMNPIYGLFAQISHFLGFTPIDWLSEYPLFSIILMIAWQWLPFACLIFMTALQSMDREQLEAARMDGANYLQQLRYLYIPHLGRSIAVVIMIEMIFLLSVFAEIFTTTGGGPGFETTNVAFLIFRQALASFDVGVASAGGLFAVLLANIAAIFFIRLIGKNLEK
ncbi:carbohydrate ABC transporter permease [Glaciimonas sp. GG7]